MVTKCHIPKRLTIKLGVLFSKKCGQGVENVLELVVVFLAAFHTQLALHRLRAARHGPTADLQVGPCNEENFSLIQVPIMKLAGKMEKNNEAKETMRWMWGQGEMRELMTEGKRCEGEKKKKID